MVVVVVMVTLGLRLGYSYLYECPFAFSMNVSAPLWNDRSYLYGTIVKEGSYDGYETKGEEWAIQWLREKEEVKILGCTHY